MKARQSGDNVGKVAPHFHLLLWGLPSSWASKNATEIQLGWMWPTQLNVMNGRWRWKREVWKDDLLENSREIAWHDFGAGGKTTHDGKTVEVSTSERLTGHGQKSRSVEYWVHDETVSVDREIAEAKERGCTFAQVELKEWVSTTWYEVVGSEDPRHLRAGTNCEQIRSREGVMFFASKYVCKLDTEAIGNAGRFWGVHNVQEIPWAEVVNVPMDGRQAVRVMRVARRYIWATQRLREHPRKIHWRARCGMTFFCDASWWLQRLAQLAGGEEQVGNKRGGVGVTY